MSTIDTIPISTPRGSLSLLLVLVRKIEMAVEKRRSRRALMELGDDQLKDIGISRSQAFAEANRSFWE